MKKLFRLAIVSALLCIPAIPQILTSPIRTIADITGDAAAHQLSATSVRARWVLIVTLSTNSAVVRVGDASTSASRGAAVAAGGGLMFPSIAGTLQQPVLYDLSTIYYYAANNDKITVVYAQ